MFRLSAYIKNGDGRVLIHHSNLHPNLSSLVDLLNLTSNNKSDFVSKLGVKKMTTIPTSISTSVLKENLFAVSDNQLMSTLKKLNMDVVCVSDVDERESLERPAYLYLANSRLKLNHIFNIKDSKSVLGNKVKLNFVNDEESVVNTYKADSIINVCCHPQTSTSSFDWDVYKNNLNTKEYGQALIFKKILESTQEVLKELPLGSVKADGLVVTASQQTKGRGRSGNQWLSPLGCMMFSTQINISPSSLLGQRISFIQHLVVVAFVKAIKSRPGYENLQLSIKWPNDIYINGKSKVGGVIVNSSYFNDNFSIIIGLGVNISNEEPTNCVNRLIREHNANHGGTGLEEITIEEALANTMNHLESLVQLFNAKGVEVFKNEYYGCWMHSDAQVTLECENNAIANIVGLDDFGYLEVKLQNGKKMGLQPDGNSFDMMRNMITLKK